MIFRWLWALHPGIAIAVMTLAATAAVVAVTYVYSSIWQRGYDAKTKEIATENRKANDAVKSGIKNIDDCYRRGGSWDSTRGVCS